MYMLGVPVGEMPNTYAHVECMYQLHMNAQERDHIGSVSAMLIKRFLDHSTFMVLI